MQQCVDSKLSNIGEVDPAQAVGLGDLALNTVAETAERMKCSVRTVWSLIERGELGSIQVGRLRRVPDVEIRRFIRSQLEDLAVSREP